MGCLTVVLGQDGQDPSGALNPQGPVAILLPFCHFRPRLRGRAPK
jgi:hypothetical protein